MVFQRQYVLMLLASLILPLYWLPSSARLHGPTAKVANERTGESRRKHVKETLQVIKDSLTIARDTLVLTDVLKSLEKLANVAPSCVGVLFSLVNVELTLPSKEDPVLEEVRAGFAEVNRKLDSLSIQLPNLVKDVEWFSYASIYSQDEARILNAWRNFNEFREDSDLAQTEEDKLRLVEIFTNFYEYTETEASVTNLYYYLTASGTSLSENLNHLLMKKFKCDLNKMGRYNIYFSSLLLKGILLNEIYWRLIGLNPSNKAAKHDQMFKNVYRAQLSAVELCLNNYEQYMRQDIMKISNALSPDNKKAIAAQVKEALDKKYNWYNWVVLVYNTEQDEHHKLYNLTKIPVGKVTIAVGYTMKGKLPPKDLVHCFTSKEKCEQAVEDISQCTMKRSRLPSPVNLREYVKLKHVIYGEDFAEAPDPFLQVECDPNWEGYHKSKVFVHYSKSWPVCSDKKCKNGGECQRVLDSNEWLCKCLDGYYGDTCEDSIDMSKASMINMQHPVPHIATKLKLMESRLERKLEEILKSIKELCRNDWQIAPLPG